MSGPWKLLTLTHNGQPILVNTALFETVRPDPDGTRLYPRVANQSVFLGIAEPFELVCAMLTEQPGEPGLFTEESESAVQAARG